MQSGFLGYKFSINLQMNKVFSILEYFLLLLIVLQFGCVYGIFEGFNRFVVYTPIFLAILLLFFLRKHIRFSHLKLVVLYLLGSMIPFITSPPEGYIEFIQKFILFLPLMFLLLSVLRSYGDGVVRSFLLKYSDIVFVIAIISLIMWLCGSVLHIISPTGILPYEWAKSKPVIPSFYGVYFETQTAKIAGLSICRNTSIFYEGPYYNMILCTAFLIEYYCRLGKNKYRMILLAITIISTITTTGMFFLLAFGAYHLYTKIQKSGCLLFMLLPLILICTYWGGSYLLESKQKDGEGSYNTRLETIMVDIETGFAHPLWGVGFMNGDFEGTNKFHEDQSNSLFYLFALGGIYGLALYVGALLIIPYINYKRNGDSRYFFIMLLFFCVFAMTLSLFSYLVLLFIAWNLSNLNKRNQSLVRRKIIQDK